MAAPELAAVMTVFKSNESLGPVIFYPLWTSDVAGLLALVAALHSGVAPPPLVVGYVVTVVAGVLPFVGNAVQDW